MFNGGFDGFISGFSFNLDIDKIFYFIKKYNIIEILYSLIKALV